MFNSLPLFLYWYSLPRAGTRGGLPIPFLFYSFERLFHRFSCGLFQFFLFGFFLGGAVLLAGEPRPLALVNL